MKFSGTEFSHPGDDSAIEELQGSLWIVTENRHSLVRDFDYIRRSKFSEDR
jgi:hypothetical protein